MRITKCNVLRRLDALIRVISKLDRCVEIWISLWNREFINKVATEGKGGSTESTADVRQSEGFCLHISKGRII